MEGYRGEASTHGWENARRVLAVRLDNVGDIVLLGPALRALRAALPDAEITLLASPGGAKVAPLLPWVDDTIAHRASWQDLSADLSFDPAREQRFVEQLAARGFDAAFVFTSFTQSPWPPAYACYLAGIPDRAGQSTDFGGSLLTEVVRADAAGGHQAERNLHLLRGVGVPVDRSDLELFLPVDAVASAAALLAGIGLGTRDRFVIAAPGASAHTRRYPPGRFAEIVSALERRGCPVVVVGSQSEAPAIAPALAPATRNLVGRTSVPELAAIVATSSLVVCNNSGPLHLADAFRRPVVCTYGGAELESQWRPRSSPAILLGRPAGCSPCHDFACPFDLECLDVAPAVVVDACLRMLETPADIEESLCPSAS